MKFSRSCYYLSRVGEFDQNIRNFFAQVSFIALPILRAPQLGQNPLFLQLNAVECFAKNCGLNKSQTKEIVEQSLSNTREFSAHVNTLKTVPDENKERLIKQTELVCKKLLEN